MISSADITIEQIEAPVTRWCSSGHIPPDNFHREGPDKPEEPTRFYHISDGRDIDNVYCELCLIVANHMAKEVKKGK